MKNPTVGGLTETKKFCLKGGKMEAVSNQRGLQRETLGNPVSFDLKRMASGRWENIQGQGQGIDVSSKGLGFVTPIPLNKGEILCLNFPVISPNTTLPVFSEVRWSRQEGEHYRVGVAFLG